MPVFRTLAFIATSCLLCSTPSHAQIERAGKIDATYQELCASCHGPRMEGGQAPSMLDTAWVHGGDDQAIASSIRNGYPDKGMPAWAGKLSDDQIRTMVILIRERGDAYRRASTPPAKPAESMRVDSQLHSFTMKTWVADLQEPWSLAFLPGGLALTTEKSGALYVIENGKRRAAPVTGVPSVNNQQQAGLYDVVPHPQYASNGWLYLAFADPQTAADGSPVSLTRIVRGKLRGNALVEQQTIYQAALTFYPKAGGVHYGGRIAFDRQGYLYFTIGERGTRTNAQDLSVPMGKVHRLFDDGRIPDDNPFAKDAKALPTIWSYGHRNPQGLAVEPMSGRLFDAEHGPRGGDELNVVLPGRNYGWPAITYGMEYDGSPITHITRQEGMEQPINYWVPSIGICGINFYVGELFPKWRNHLFVASLAGQDVRRLEIVGDQVVSQEVLFANLGRVRHVIGGPDGALYVLLPERIARIAP